jgi:hypothetical protein
MQGIERDQVAREAELAEQRLSGRDLVGLDAPLSCQAGIEAAWLGLHRTPKISRAT